MEKVGDLAKRFMRGAVRASERYPEGKCITCGTDVEPLVLDGATIRAYICDECERLGRE